MLRRSQRTAVIETDPLSGKETDSLLEAPLASTATPDDGADKGDAASGDVGTC